MDAPRARHVNVEPGLWTPLRTIGMVFRERKCQRKSQGRKPRRDEEGAGSSSRARRFEHARTCKAPSDGRFSDRNCNCGGEHPGTVLNNQPIVAWAPTHISRKNTLMTGPWAQKRPVKVPENGEWSMAVGCTIEGLLMHHSSTKPTFTSGPPPIMSTDS